LIPTGRTIWIVDAHRDDGRRFIVRADEKLSAFVELEREVLTVTFYLASIHPDSCQCTLVVVVHRDGKRFVVRADEKLTAFLELEKTISVCDQLCLTSRRGFFKTGRHESIKSFSLLTILDDIVAAPGRLRRNAREQYAGLRSQPATRRTDSWWLTHCFCERESPV